MPNDGNTPEFTELPDQAGGPEPWPGKDYPAPERHPLLSRPVTLTIAICLLLGAGAYLALRNTGLPPGPPADPLPAPEEAMPGARPPAEAQPPAAPEYTGGAPDHLTPATGLDSVENIAPPAPGLLMPRLSLETLAYTGPALPPEAIAKETDEDRAGCKTGDMFKCLRLGGRYLAGHGVERDEVRAFGLINKACAGGIAEGCTLQGLMQMAGYGTPIDVPAGLALQEKTCNAGDMGGCTMLGNLYIEGKLLPPDVPRGLGYLRKACDAKAGTACLALGALFNDGKAVPRDASVAEYLFGQACEFKDKTGCLLQQQLVQKRLAAEHSR